MYERHSDVLNELAAMATRGVWDEQRVVEIESETGGSSGTIEGVGGAVEEMQLMLGATGFGSASQYKYLSYCVSRPENLVASTDAWRVTWQGDDAVVYSAIGGGWYVKLEVY